MLTSFDLAKHCKHLSDDIWETSWYECVANPQYTQVTWSGGRPDQDIMLIFPEKRHVYL